MALPASAQDNTVSWEPYPFTMTLPADWVTDANANRLIAAPGVDLIGQAIQGEQVARPLIRVDVVAPMSVADLTFMVTWRVQSQEVVIGDQTYGIMRDFIPSATHRSDMVLVAETYVLTFIAPRSEWENGFEQQVTQIITSIGATPYIPTGVESLRQNVRWHDVELRVPDSWLLFPERYDNLARLTIDATRRQIDLFSPQELMIEVIDISAFRTAIQPEDLPLIQGVFYNLTAIDDKTGQLGIAPNVTLNPITTTAVGNIRLYTMDFNTETFVGRAILAQNAERAFVLVGMASEINWNSGDSALFDAIISTLSFAP